eukprot:2871014-Amphidinium_carterae.1
MWQSCLRTVQTKCYLVSARRRRAVAWHLQTRLTCSCWLIGCRADHASVINMEENHPMQFHILVD